MGIEVWYWFHKGRQKQKYQGEFDQIIGTSGTVVLYTILVLVNQKQNKHVTRMHHWSNSNAQK